ncbi:MAG: efflux RND transporter periplasmic adaptor subunit, partial [Ancalomicrobiaceae bacterium]|nr:efflux RND transporter periplasmic adaptor subunit [Ancalomicrobiaceae bacterium]
MTPSKLALLVVVAIVGGAVVYPNYAEVRAFALKQYEFGKKQYDITYELALAEYARLTKPPAPPAPPPMQAMPVPVVAVSKRSLPVTLDYSARVEAVATVTLQARASGYLIEQLEPDGSDVKEGDLLYRIDPRDYDAVIELAKAQLARDTASLDYLKSNLDRGSDLAKSGYVSKDSFDQRTSAAKQAESALAIDRATIRTAELNRANTEIRAPFSGRLGRSIASIGTLVGSTGTALNTLVKLDP